RAPGDSKRGLDHLLPPGLGRQQHIDQALGLPSPFTQQRPMDDDLHVVAEMMVVFGPRSQVWRERQRGSLRRIMDAMEPIRASLLPRRSSTSVAVAADGDVAGIASLTAALPWPGRSQAEGCLNGFKVVGEIESSRILRGVRQPNLTGSYYGQAAMDEELTQEGISKGFTEPLVTARSLDRRFGPGNRRPIHRFLIRLPDGKTSLIDDCKRGGQNQWSALAETIYTIGVDTVPAMVCLLVHRARKHYPDEGLPEWFHLRLGTDDLPDAFRGCPIHPSQQNAAVVAVWSPKGHTWMFGVMQGCPYGLESVVVTSIRFPPVITAAMRRMLGLMAAAYFDDNLLVDFECSARDAKGLLQQTFAE
ncbi:unnamed protein product, partial [Prorocentrum cordatum]